MGITPANAVFRQAPLTYGVVARASAAGCLAQLGEFVEAATLVQEALRAAEATALPWDLVVAIGFQGDIHLQQGTFTSGVAALERGVALCESADLAFFSRGISARLGYAYARTGRAGEGVLLLEAMGQQLDEPGAGGLPIHFKVLTSPSHIY
jgi:hypothetical protein